MNTPDESLSNSSKMVRAVSVLSRPHGSTSEDPYISVERSAMACENTSNKQLSGRHATALTVDLHSACQSQSGMIQLLSHPTLHAAPVFRRQGGGSCQSAQRTSSKLFLVPHLYCHHAEALQMYTAGSSIGHCQDYQHIVDDRHMRGTRDLTDLGGNWLV